MIAVRSWGVAGSVVDGGQTGRLWLGKSRGGAVDVESLMLANRVVGNAAFAAALESSGGLTVMFDEATAIAIAGAVADVNVSGGPPVGWGSAVLLPAGCTLRIGRLLDGARVYIAVRGGVAVEAAGDSLRVGPGVVGQPVTEPVPRPTPSTTVGVWPGPRRDWFDESAWNLLRSSAYRVTATNRIGARLGGPALDRSHLDELPSEGLVEGAVQVPPDGQPIVMLADHPTTGGYPVIAVVDPGDLRHVAQAAVGTELRFTARH